MKRLILLGFLTLSLVGCSGSGAVSPLSPVNASKVDDLSTADSQVIYWSNFPLEKPVTDSINAVCLINDHLGWACGNNGLVLKYDGQTWNKVQVGLGQNENFMTVGFLNAEEGWIAGTHGIILHYNNGQWTQDNSPTSEVLYDIAITRSRTVWLVGANGTILNYNGVSWGTVFATSGPTSSPVTVTTDIYSIGLADQNNGWAVGAQGLILQYNGQKWQPYPATPTTERLNSVSVLSDVEAYAVGAYGTILYFNGTTWAKMPSAFSGFDLYTIDMQDDSDGWIAGQDGTIAFYDGTRWIPHQRPITKPSLNSIAFYKDLGFMVGQDGTILKYQKGGVPTKYDVALKGQVEFKPTLQHPYWVLTYNLLNESSTTTPFLNFVLPVPKGFEPYSPKLVPTPTPVKSETTPTMVSVTPVLTASVLTTAQEKTPEIRPESMPPGSWKMQDGNFVWVLGAIKSGEKKSVVVLLAEKRDSKKVYPAVMTGSLRTSEQTVVVAAPVTLLSLVSKPELKSTLTPTASVTVQPFSPEPGNSQRINDVTITPTVQN